MIVRRWTLATVVAFSTMVAGLALSGTAALAVAPEAPGPVTVQLPVGATKVTVHGVLSPKAEGHPGTYEFLYKKGSLSCEGEGKAPASPGMMLGFEAEEVTETLTGLEAHTEYAVCLLARNPKGETAVGPAVTFTTALALEAPTTTALPAGVTALTATTATLHGVLNPLAQGEAGTWEFAYRQSASECQRENPETGQRENEKATPTEPAVGNAGEAVQATAAELLPNTRYTFCLLARNEAGETALGAPVTFTTSTEAPMITGETFSHVTPTGATVTAEVNTENLPGEYYYLYGTKSEFEAKAAHKTPEVNLPASSVPVPAPAHLTGLQPDTEYHFVLVATNADSGINLGEILSFTTLPESAPGLPDDRTFERVTPVENYDANVYVPKGLSVHFVEHDGEIETELPFQVAVGGEAVAYAADPTLGGTGERGYSLGNEYLARRSPEGGWMQANVNPPVESAFYQAFSSDLSIGILESGTFEGPEIAPLSAQAPGDGYTVLYTHMLSGEGFQPFFTIKPPNRAPGEFGFNRFNGRGMFPHAPQELEYAGASADFSRLLFKANDAFAGTGAVDGGAEENNLYESVDGKLSLVNVLPDGSTEPNATFGAIPFRLPEKNLPDFENVISGDGSRIFWTDLNPGKENLYVSEGVGSSSERTVQVDASQVGGLGGGGRFWTASKDGSKAFFTDENPLTVGSSAAPGAPDLYEYDVESGHLSDLTMDSHAGEAANVQGVLGASEDGSTVYFIAQGILAGNKNSQEAEARAGADNLYVLREGSQPTFIAALSPKDGDKAIDPLSPSGNEEFGDWQPGLGHRTAEVTPDGRGLVFMSQESLTGYRNDVEGAPVEEVYVYEAEGGGLFCVSCNRSGEPPQLNPESEPGPSLAAYLPVSWSNTYLPQLISEDGSRVFFDSDQPLVPQDTNGEQDVYEWERDGSDGCQVSGGCVYLLSGGVNETSSWLIGASASGDDVFIVSREQLVPGPSNGAYDLYDARVGAVPVSGSACTGTGCQGVPSAPPAFATPPSGTYEGVGDFPPPAPAKPEVKPKAKAKSLTRAQKLAQALRTCRQKRKKARSACEAQARKRYGSRSKAKSRKGGK